MYDGIKWSASHFSCFSVCGKTFQKPTEKNVDQLLSHFGYCGEKSQHLTKELKFGHTFHSPL
jgi:hypothetical protein